MSVLAAAVVFADLCGAHPAADATRDPADSAAYTAVGDEARAQGDLRTAVIAYRRALALDPDNARASAGFVAVCGDVGADDRAALLDAIARYRAGDDGAAEAALSAIVRGGASPATAGAHFFLGLIALEHHATATAARELEIARGDPDYRALAIALLRLAHRDGAVAVALLFEPELDTNPQLLPDTPPAGAVTGAPATDEDLLSIATITGRPAPWLAVRNTLTWRNQRQLSALDFIADDLETAADLAAGKHRASIRYDLDYDLLDGAPYLVASRGAIAYRFDGAVAPVLSYSLRRRDYLRDTEHAFTGWVQAAEAGVVVQLGAGIELDARATLAREITADPLFANVSAGLRVMLRTRSTAPVRLIAGASGSYARYDLAQPDGELRSDVPLAGSADLEVDLGDHVIAVAGAAVARNQSTIEDFRYAKLIVRCGLVVAWGGL